MPFSVVPDSETVGKDANGILIGSRQLFGEGINADTVDWGSEPGMPVQGAEWSANRPTLRADSFNVIPAGSRRTDCYVTISYSSDSRRDFRASASATGVLDIPKPGRRQTSFDFDVTETLIPYGEYRFEQYPNPQDPSGLLIVQAPVFQLMPKPVSVRRVVFEQRCYIASEINIGQIAIIERQIGTLHDIGAFTLLFLGPTSQVTTATPWVTYRWLLDPGTRRPDPMQGGTFPIYPDVDVPRFIYPELEEGDAAEGGVFYRLPYHRLEVTQPLAELPDYQDAGPLPVPGKAYNVPTAVYGDSPTAWLSLPGDPWQNVPIPPG